MITDFVSITLLDMQAGLYGTAGLVLASQIMYNRYQQSLHVLPRQLRLTHQPPIFSKLMRESRATLQLTFSPLELEPCCYQVPNSEDTPRLLALANGEQHGGLKLACMSAAQNQRVKVSPLQQAPL